MSADRELLMIATLSCALALGAMPRAFGQAEAGASEQQKSRAQIEWEKKLSPRERTQPGFAFVAEDPKLPRVLLIGDSISIGYTPAVRQLLKGKANVLRIPANGGSTADGLAKLGGWLGSGKWDVIHFNWGLHDIKHMKGGKLDVTGERQVSVEQYEKNLNELLRRLKATRAALIWAATTPVPGGSGGRIEGDEIEVNRIAANVMAEHGVPINDLHSYVLPRLAEFQTPKNVHFTEDGYAFLAKQVADTVLDALKGRSGSTQSKPAKKRANSRTMR